MNILLTIPQAADALGIGRTKTYELISTGELPAVRIGRAVRIPARAVEDFAIRLEQEQRWT